MAMKDCTSTELLRQALLFLNSEKPRGIDDTSEFNSSSSLVSEARNLLMLRRNYNAAKNAVVLLPVIVIDAD